MNQPEKKQAVVFDFNRTLFDPIVYGLYHGVVPMLEELSSSKILLLYSRKGWDRSGLLRSLGIDHYFKAVRFVETKTAENLRELLSEASLSPGDAVIVGDMLADEICVGGTLGMTTVWMAQSITESEMGSTEPVCVPDHTVRSIEELHELLSAL